MERSKDSTISARISIQWHSTSHSYRNNDFQTIELHGEEGWTKVSESITLAQQHIVKCSKKDVAPDVIEISTKHPDHVDLTLVDLPGIVHTTVGLGDKSTIVQEIDQLLKEYWSNTLCILLVIVPGNVNFRNCKALDYAHRVDPDTTQERQICSMWS